jgi:RES domain-containing protein
MDCLPEVTVYRIADSRGPVFDGMGALLHGGRWNSPGRTVVYCAETYACAMLEVLVHANLSMIPKHQVSVQVEIPDGVIVETLDEVHVAGWPHSVEVECRMLGDAWLQAQRSAVLRVPSVATAGYERNVLINPAHPDFARMMVTEAVPVRWDPRLFSASR